MLERERDEGDIYEGGREREEEGLERGRERRGRERGEDGEREREGVRE